jgi:hypothetical protein
MYFQSPEAGAGLSFRRRPQQSRLTPRNFKPRYEMPLSKAISPCFQVPQNVHS